MFFPLVYYILAIVDELIKVYDCKREESRKLFRLFVSFNPKRQSVGIEHNFRNILSGM